MQIKYNIPEMPFGDRRGRVDRDATRRFAGYKKNGADQDIRPGGGQE